jgi:hypothetical protein
MNSALDNDDEDETLPTAKTADDSSDDDSPASPINPAVVDYISKLKAAQSTSNDNQLLAGLARAGGTISSAIARTAAPDQSVYNALDKNAQTPVDQVEADQATAVKQIKLNSDASEAAVTAAENDPDSEQSKAFRAALAQVPGVKAAYGDEFEDLTAADKQNVFDVIKTKEQIDGRRADKQAARDSKTDVNQDKAYTSMRKDLESFKGNGVAKQAAMDVYSASKALTLVNGKDPDTLTTQDLANLTSEISKIATGGVPTEHGVTVLMPNNLQTKFAEMKNFLESKPTDANAGAYIQHNMAYLKDMTGEANKVVNNYRSNIAKGYRNRVKPDDYAEAQTDYGLSPEATATTTQAPKPQAQALSPQDQQAITWAQANPNDPRSAKILKLHGGQ